MNVPDDLLYLLYDGLRSVEKYADWDMPGWDECMEAKCRLAVILHPEANRQRMINAVMEATGGHVGLYNAFGQYEGGCACGWEGNAAELIDHIDAIIEGANR